MANASYFVPLVVLPTVIDGPGSYFTRRGEVVDIACASRWHDFGCVGTYSCGTTERWHKSGRLFASKTTLNDVVARNGSVS